MRPRKIDGRLVSSALHGLVPRRFQSLFVIAGPSRNPFCFLVGAAGFEPTTP